MKESPLLVLMLLPWNQMFSTRVLLQFWNRNKAPSVEPEIDTLDALPTPLNVMLSALAKAIAVML